MIIDFTFEKLNLPSKKIENHARQIPSIEAKVYSASIFSRDRCTACKSDSTFFTNK